MGCTFVVQHQTKLFDIYIVMKFIFLQFSCLVSRVTYQGRNLIWSRGTTTPELKLFENLVKTKIGLHNSCIRRNVSVLFTISLPLCYNMALFWHWNWSFSFYWEELLQICPPPQDFQKLHLFHFFHILHYLKRFENSLNDIHNTT